MWATQRLEEGMTAQHRLLGPLAACTGCKSVCKRGCLVCGPLHHRQLHADHVEALVFMLRGLHKGHPQEEARSQRDCALTHGCAGSIGCLYSPTANLYLRKLQLGSSSYNVA